MSWIEQQAERRIREAEERGEFEASVGIEIEGLDEPYDPLWWVKKWIKREGVDQHTLKKLFEEGGNASRS